MGMHRYGLMEYLKLNLNGYGVYPDYPISLPRLHTIDLGNTLVTDMIISSVMLVVANWDLPALRTVSLTSILDPQPLALKTFFAAHDGITTINPISFLNSGSCLHFILPHCTGVEDLTVVAGQLLQAPLPPITYLRRITIYRLSKDRSTVALDNLFRVHGPKLCTIRLDSADHKLQNRLYQEWKERWALEGVHLEFIARHV
jgi:hypothetical protein